MAVVYLSPIFNWQNLNVNLSLLANGTIETYEAQSSTPLDTYTTQAGDVQNQNPIELDSDGRPPEMIWLISGEAYKFILKDADGNPIGPTFDNITGVNDPQTIPSLPTIDGYAALPSANGGGTASDITATFSPAITPTDRLTVIVKSTSANPGAVTFDPNSTGPLPVVKAGDTPLGANDIPGSEYYLILTYNASLSKWVLNNPSYSFDGSFGGVVSVTTTPYNISSVNVGKQHTLSGAASLANLPEISGSGFTAGKTYPVVNYLSSNCTVAPNASDTFVGTNTLNGTTTLITIPPYSAVIFTVASANTWNVTGVYGGQFERILSVGNIAVQTNIDFALATLDPTQALGNLYQVELTNLAPVTDSVELIAAISNDNAATFLNTLYDSSNNGCIATNSGSGTPVSNTSKVSTSAKLLGDGAGQGLGNGSNEKASIILQLRNMNTGTSLLPWVMFQGCFYSETGEFSAGVGSFSRKSTSDYDGIRFSLSSGDFDASGFYVLKKLMKNV